MSKSYKRALKEAIIFGFCINIGKFISAENEQEFLLALLRVIFITPFALIAFTASSSKEIRICERKKEPQYHLTPHNYQVDWSYGNLGSKIAYIVGIVVLSMQIIISLMEWLICGTTTIFSNIWNIFAVVMACLAVLGIIFIWFMQSKIVLTVTPTDVRFQSWLFSAQASWDDIIGIEVEGKKASLVFRNLEITGNTFIKLNKDLLFHIEENAIPLSIFGWDRHGNELRQHIEGYLRFES